MENHIHFYNYSCLYFVRGKIAPNQEQQLKNAACGTPKKP
jgi:hypothetical protein